MNSTMHLWQVNLSSNALCGIYIDAYGRLQGTYTDEGIKALSAAIAVSGSLTEVRFSPPHRRALL